MEQNELFASLFNLAETDEQKERVVFAALVASLVRGELHELLKNAPVGACEEYGRNMGRTEPRTYRRTVSASQV